MDATSQPACRAQRANTRSKSMSMMTAPRSNRSASTGPGSGTLDSEVGVKDSGFGIRDSGFGIRDSGFGIRSSGRLGGSMVLQEIRDARNAFLKPVDRVGVGEAHVAFRRVRPQVPSRRER